VRAIPVAGDLPDYGARKARGDLIAALTVAALAVPSAMAYAELAGLTAVAGLYALLLPTVAHADPLPQLVEIVRELGDVDGPTLAVGAIALAILLPLRFLARACRPPCWSWSGRSPRRRHSTSPPKAWPSWAPSRPGSPRSRCRRRSWRTRSPCCPPQSASSWSASPTRSSRRARSRASTTSTSASTRSSSPWAPHRRPPA
jgi:hypothetical protein